VNMPSGGSCNLPGANGTVWQKIGGLSVPKQTKTGDLKISVNWPAKSSCNVKGGEDDVLIDGVNLY
jgi:hypothetical protein